MKDVGSSGGMSLRGGPFSRRTIAERGHLGHLGPRSLSRVCRVCELGCSYPLGEAFSQGER